MFLKILLNNIKSRCISGLFYFLLYSLQVKSVRRGCIILQKLAWASVAALSAAIILAHSSLFLLRILGEWDIGRGQDLTCFKKVSPASDMPNSLIYCILSGKLSSRPRNAWSKILLILARVYILVGSSRKSFRYCRSVLRPFPARGSTLCCSLGF